MKFTFAYQLVILVEVLSAGKMLTLGECIFFREGIELETIDLGRFSVEFDGEFAGVRLPNENLNVISLYRSPNGSLDHFFINFESVI